MTNNQFEVSCRAVARDKLQIEIRKLERMAERERDARDQRRRYLAQYETLEEAQEAYGYGNITQNEYDWIQDIFDGTTGDNTPSVTEAALSILRDFRNRLAQEIRDFQWADLPDAVKERITRETEERHARHTARASTG